MAGPRRPWRAGGVLLDEPVVPASVIRAR
ncbi:MAG: hypothetical protein K0Q86_1964, partial [Arthrobacter koreensis]|nr:hypothetical protein [Arthrobacter koreensis]